MTPLLWLAVVLLLGVLLYRHAISRPPNFPPGPPRLPIWGSLWLLFLFNYKFLHKALLKMAKRYKTNVMGFYLGDFPCVVACDHESVNELLRHPEFQGRPDILLARVRSLGGRYGIVFTDGPEWVEQRRFFLRQMRDFGFGRRYESLETVMQQEVADIVDLLHGNWKDEFVVKGDSVMISHLFAPCILNCLWHLFGGEKFPRGSHQPIHAVSQASVNFMRNIDSSGRAVSMTPWLQYVSPGGFGVKSVKRISETLINFVKKSVLEHQSTLSERHKSNYIDVYLKEMESKQNTLPAVFNENQLLLTGMDMLMATSTALGGGLIGLFNMLVHYPEVQKKVQAEIDDVIGRDKIATLDDRKNMPYLEATIRESLRRGTLLALSVPHACTEDTHFRGYFIPKGTIVYPHLWAAHMDPEIWGDPENFRPERFLDENGMLIKKDLTTPFGVGKRLCTGETFSRQLMFLILAGILQNFSLEPADPKNLPCIDDNQSGFSLQPPDIWAKIIPRC